MKRKELIIINSAIVGLAVIFGLLTLGLSVNDNLGNLASGAFSRKDESAQKQAMADITPQCSKKSPLNLNTAAKTDPHLAKLQEYQDTCESYVTNRFMVFTNFAGTREAGVADAGVMAAKLKTFKAAGVSPIVIAEPYIAEGAMSYKTYLSGAYDEGIDQYFKSLKAAGITDDMLGLWVPFPESNIPEWNNKDTEPRDYALCVNRYLGTLKKYFPKAKTSILLNATTYDPNDIAYENGDYISLVPYLQEIDKNLVDSMGIQGFPWVSNATQPRREIFRASEFLQPDLAIEAARELRTRDIWFNTGTFAAKYTNSTERRVAITPNERKAILTDILATAKGTENYQQNEYRVFINLFAEDKSEANEATDWSYFQDNESKVVLREFLSQANKLTVPVSLYDKQK
jgi:hypothetical protein